MDAIQKSLLEQVAEGKLPNRREDLLPLLKQWDSCI